MTTLQALCLGILQGFTEFFPISSSGHLVIAEKLFAIRFSPEDLQGLNVLLHAGTLLALAILYARTWVSLLSAPFTNDDAQTKMLIALVISTIPAAIIGVLFEDHIAEIFSDPSLVAVAFLVTAVALVLGELSYKEKQGPFSFIRRFIERHTEGHLRISSALFIGVAQACALIPGLSRSGLTMSAGRVAGLTRRESLDFSFLMLTPILTGAVLLTMRNIVTGEITLPPLPIVVTGMAAACLCSVLSIVFLRRFVMRFSLVWFTPYLIGLALLILL